MKEYDINTLNRFYLAEYDPESDTWVSRSKEGWSDRHCKTEEAIKNLEQLQKFAKENIKEIKKAVKIEKKRYQQRSKLQKKLNDLNK